MKSRTGRQELYALLGIGVQVGVLLPHSRTQESEADRIGLEIMARAGFDPAESVELWRNMSRDGGRQPPEFLSTHPSHGRRIEDLEESQARVRPLFTNARSAGRNPVCSR
jgi:predicted Zn-dependent protease